MSSILTPARRPDTQRSDSPRPATALSADRFLGAILILLQLAVLGYLSGARLFPIVMALLTVWGARTRVRLKVEITPRNFVYAILAIGFLLHYMLAPYPLAVDAQFVRSSLSHSLARLLLAVQVVQLLLQHPTGRLPVWLAPCGAVTLAFATNVSSPESVHFRLLFLIAAFIAVFALYSGRARRLVPGAPRSGWFRGGAMSAALLLVVLFGSGSSWALQEHERTIESFLTDYLGYSSGSRRTGFNPSGRLEAVTAWRADGSGQIVLRIFSDEAPGYLRGAVFDNYQGSSRETSYTPWLATSPRRPLPQIAPARSDPELRPGDVLYEVSADRSASRRTLDVWPEEATEAVFFTPLGTQTFAAPDGDLVVNANGIISQPDRMDSIPYTLTAGAIDDIDRDTAREMLSDARRSELTALDVPVDPAVEALAAEVFAGCRTSVEKIAAVQRYFHANYHYHLGINIPHRMDPVTFFLTQRPGAHCEYFATGTAVLLRIAQVPSRYVVGFVAAERNDVAGFWVARQKDAHAWVEAYDDESRRWVIVESTPAAGVPQPTDRSYPAQLAETIRHRLSIWRMSLREYGVAALWATLVRVVWSIPGLIALLGIFVVVLFQYRPQWSVHWRRQQVPEELRSLHRQLARLDRQARRHGFERAPHETLSHFAGRLRGTDTDSCWGTAAADCYELYIDLRYRGQPDENALQQLREAASRLARLCSAEQAA
jgi:protein-glutamine gamma-glutamyltransferase